MGAEEGRGGEPEWKLPWEVLKMLGSAGCRGQASPRLPHACQLLQWWHRAGGTGLWFPWVAPGSTLPGVCADVGPPALES